MPKHGITALVDFVETFEAKKAFSKLAYSQFKSAPLYLEWAPENIFVKSSETIESNEKESVIEEKTSVTENVHHSRESEVAEKKQEKQDRKDEIFDDIEEPENDTTLFVKNLNFKTTEESLRAVSIILSYH